MMKKTVTFVLEFVTMLAMFATIYGVWVFLAAMSAPAPV